MGKIRGWLFGIVEVCVAQGQIERFLNLCRNRGLEIYQMAHQGEEYRFWMRLMDYRCIKPVARKLGVLPLVTRRKGFPFLLGEWRKRKVLTGGFLLFVLLIFFMTNMIWSIDIEGCYSHTEEALLEFLEEKNVRCGMFYKNLDYKKTEDMIRLAYQDISWVSVERVGTRLHIRLKESNLVNTKTEKEEPAHLVASKDGVVQSIVTRSGTPMVKAGDQVKKGDVLISGIVEVFGDYETPVNTHLVYADGDVEIVSEQSYYSVLDMEYEKKVYTGKERESISLKGFGYYAELFSWGSKKIEQEDQLTEERIFWINPSLKFPIFLRKTWHREYETVRLRYTEEEAAAIEEKKLADYLAQLEKKGVLILQNNVKIEVQGAICVTEGNVSTSYREEQHREIMENEWRNTETDEYNGNGS